MQRQVVKGDNLMSDRFCGKWMLAISLAVAWAAPVLAGPPRPATEEKIKELIAAAGEAEDYDNAAIVYVLDEADVYVQDSGLAITESCRVIRILTDEGIRAQSVLRFEFDPDTYRVTIKSVRVHRADGTIETVPVSSAITQPTKQWLIFWGGEQHLLEVPRLEIGDSLEIRASKIGFNIAYLSDGVTNPQSALPTGSSRRNPQSELVPPMPGHWYEVTLFQGGYPIIEKRYSVHMPKDKPVQYEVYNGTLRSSLWFDEDYHVYTWRAKNVPAIKREPHMVSTNDCATKLVMATLPTWEEKSRWFHQVNEPQFDADEAIRAKVLELTAGLEDEEAKIAACVHWVADNVRYYGTSRGPREGYTLHRSIETFRDRGGVCKDKAGMAVTMLRVLGHEVYPALTMAGSRVDGIPADQFNHTVTVMRNKDGSFRILDPTWVPASRELWSSREPLQGLVYGTPEGQTLTLSPYYTPEYNLLASTSEAEIDEDGTLRMQIGMDLKGYPCTYLRRSANKHPRTEQRAAFEQALNIAPNARLERLDFIDPHDYSRDGFVDMTVSAEGYAAIGSDARIAMFRLPLMSHPLADFFIPDFFYKVDAKEREFGMRLRATRKVRYTETVKLPAGWKIVRVPDPVTLDSGSVSLTFEATITNCESRPVTDEHRVAAPSFASGEGWGKHTIRKSRSGEIRPPPLLRKDGAPSEGCPPAILVRSTLDDDAQPTLSYRFEMALKNQIVPPEDYPGLREAILAMKNLTEEWIVCTVEPPATQTIRHTGAHGQIRNPQSAIRNLKGMGEDEYDDDAVILRWEQHWTLTGDGTVRRRDHKWLKLLNLRPVRQVADPRIDFVAGRDEVIIHAARTHLPDGAVLPVPEYSFNIAAPGDVAGWPQYAAWQQRIVSFSGIEPGAILELDYEVITPPGVMPWLEAELRLSEDYPTVEREITVTVPYGVTLHHQMDVIPNVQSSQERAVVNGAGQTTYRWRAHDLPGDRGEPQSPGWQRRGSRLRFTTCPSSAAWVTAMLDRVNLAAQPDDTIKAFAESAVGDEADPAERVRRIARKLHDSFNFVTSPKALASLSRRSATDVLRANYGNELESAAVFLAAVRSLGMEASPAVGVDANLWDESGGLAPIGSAFAGVVVRVDLPGGGVHVHPRHGLFKNPGNWGRHYLLSVDEAGTLQRLYVFARGENEPGELDITGNIVVDPEGAATGDLRIRATGVFFDPSKLDTADAQKSLIERLVGRVLSDFSVKSHSVVTLSDDAFRATVSVESKGPIPELEERHILRFGEGPAFLSDVPMPLTRSYRRTDVQLASRFRESTDVMIELPEGWEPSIVPASPAKVAGPWGMVAQTVDVDDRTVRLRRNVTVNTETLSPDDFDKLRQAVNALRTNQSVLLTFRERPQPG